MVLIRWLFVFVVATCSAWAIELPGRKSTWHGFVRYDFEIQGRSVIVVSPGTAAAGRPWIWHGEFFGHRPEPDIVLLGRGFHVVYMRVPDLFGSPSAIGYWDTLYRELTQKHAFSTKPALVGLSRGGLYCFNWAATYPDRVACIYADAPVCDLHSWPLGRGQGAGNAAEVPKLLKAYGVASEEQLMARALNPIDRLEPLARAGVPLLVVYGDADKAVPWPENAGVVAERYRRLGGDISLIAKPGVGHVHGLDDSTPIIDFIYRHRSRRSHP
jgi:pimeloyl-ACP methyl ester carboxylesterase